MNRAERRRALREKPQKSASVTSSGQSDVIAELEALSGKVDNGVQPVLEKLIQATKNRKLSHSELALMRPAIDEAKKLLLNTGSCKDAVETPGSKEAEQPTEKPHHKGVVGFMLGLQANKVLNKLVKDKRLVFLEDNKLQYTDKKGQVETMDFEGFAYIMAASVQGMAEVSDLKELIAKAYQKTRAYSGGLK